MEIRGRHDIFRAAGLLLSVHFFFFFLQTSAFLLCWSGFDTAPCVMLVLLYLQIALVVPGLFAVLSQSAFFTRCYNISLQQTAPWGCAFDTNTCSKKKRKKKKKSCCFAVTFLLSNNTSLPLFGCFNFVINPVKVRLVPQAVSWSVWSLVNCAWQLDC